MAGIQNFRGRRALITGGASGLGRALAEVLLAAGAEVVIADIAQAEVAEAGAALGCESRVCDVTSREATAGLVAEAWDALGSVDLLCANAGVVRPGSILDVSDEDIRWQFDVNVWGVLNVTRPFVERLRNDGRAGHVLVTGSETSLSYPEYLRPLDVHVYTVTKHAVFSLADVLRRELEPERIGVSVLCPGGIATNLAVSSAASRAAHLGVDTEPEYPTMSDDTARAVAANVHTPAAVAEKALEGLRRGLFVIPTHPHIEADVDARFAEIRAGFPVA